MVATQIFLGFSPLPNWGKDSHFDEHIFEMGWFNHQWLEEVFPIEMTSLFGGTEHVRFQGCNSVASLGC